MTDTPPQAQRWYNGITRYQWIVLLIASLGWIFDVFEGQIFVASMNEAMPSLIPEGESPAVYNNIALAAFLLGGALGGIVFGMLSDRIGRKKTMSLTILFYSVFTCLSAFSATWWHLAIFRFLVALGVGGEWAVASALVAEVFPERARARVGGIFHASSVFGTYLAVAAGYLIVGNPLFKSEANPSLSWRLGFAVGVLPALLIIWIRRSLKEPESWEQARTRAAADQSQQMGRVSELFRGVLLTRTLVGVGLATVGLATFWGSHIYGKNLLSRDIAPYFLPVERTGVSVSAPERDANLTSLLNASRSDAVTAWTKKREQADVEPLSDLPEDARERLFQLVVEQSRDHDFTKSEFESRLDADDEWSTYLLTPKKPSDIPAGTPLNDRDERFDSTVISNELTESEAVFVISSCVAVKNRLDQEIKFWEMLGMLLATTGGGLGLLAFGPLCEKFGRKPAFLFYHIGGLVISLLAFQYVHGWWQVCLVLPVFGFLTLGMHAGYAIYFPELYPTRLRGTGAGFCFNAGRIVTAPLLIWGGLLQGYWQMSADDTRSVLSLLFLVGAVILIAAPETKGRTLPE